MENNVISNFAELPEVARFAVEARLQEGPESPPFHARGEVSKRGAVFVTIRTEEGELRGCCGVTAPVEPDLVRETWRSALAAAFRDRRFPPVTASEMPHLSFSVTLLGTLEPVTSKEELDPVIYGVLVSNDYGQRGVLLPGIEGIDSVEEQLAVVRRKAGIAEDAPLHMERFTAECFKAPPAEDKSDSENGEPASPRREPQGCNG